MPDFSASFLCPTCSADLLRPGCHTISRRLHRCHRAFHAFHVATCLGRMYGEIHLVPPNWDV